MYPTSDTTIDTPYGAEGESWGCGWHDGVDFAVGHGTPVRAMWGGTVVEAAWPTSFGSAFGLAVVIDHDKLPDGSPGGWAIYAHNSEVVVAVGQRVDAGQLIAYSGDSGNVTGPHNHTGVYMEPYWSSGGGVDPQRWLDAGAPPSGGGGDPWASGDVFQDRLVPGQDDSDSVRRLQRVLNEWSFVGGQELPITGFYGPDTQHEVALFQEQICGDPPDGAIGPKQTDVLFEKLGPWNIIR